MNEVTKILCERRSIRKFKDEHIPVEILNEILKCGTFAPNGKSKQSARIVVVQNRELIEEIAKIKMEDLNATTLEAAVEMIKGSCKAMGVTLAE